MTSLSLGIDERLANVYKHGVVLPVAEIAIMVTGGQVIFLSDLCIEFSMTVSLGVIPQKSIFTDNKHFISEKT